MNDNESLISDASSAATESEVVIAVLEAVFDLNRMESGEISVICAAAQMTDENGAALVTWLLDSPRALICFVEVSYGAIWLTWRVPATGQVGARRLSAGADVDEIVAFCFGLLHAYQPASSEATRH